MKQIIVTKPSKLMKKEDVFDARIHEMYMSTHGVLTIRRNNRIVKAYAEGQWETAEEV